MLPKVFVRLAKLFLTTSNFLFYFDQIKNIQVLFSLNLNKRMAYYHIILIAQKKLLIILNPRNKKLFS